MRIFKTGDIIKGKKENSYCVTNNRMTKAKVVSGDSSKAYMEIKILNHVGTGFIGKAYIVHNDDKFFELISEDNGKNCVVIYRNGNEVVALDKVTKEKAIAKCHPIDEFDFKTGAKLAFSRLMGEEDDEKVDETIQSKRSAVVKNPWYNGKICCLYVHELMKRYFTVGKIYTVENGKFKDDTDTGATGSLKDDSPYKTLDQINKEHNSLVFFVEVKER